MSIQSEQIGVGLDRNGLSSRRHEMLYLKGPVVRIDAPQLSKVVTTFIEPLVSGARANEGQRAYDTTLPATNAELSVSVLWVLNI
jgi:hypothetical protein